MPGFRAAHNSQPCSITTSTEIYKNIVRVSSFPLTAHLHYHTLSAMIRIITLLLLASAACLAFSSPTEKQLSSTFALEQVVSAVSRQTRRDRVPIENRLLGQLATNGDTLGKSVRGTSVATPQIIRLFDQQGSLSIEIGQVRSKLYGPNRVRGPERRALILDEDILFVQTFLVGLRIERALGKRPGLRGATRRALRTQRGFAIEIINTRFGTFTV